jgi:hypothetical protein
MGLLRSLRRRFRGRDIDTDRIVEDQAKAKELASDRDSIRVSQAAGSSGAPFGGGGMMTPTPDVLHPDEDER